MKNKIQKGTIAYLPAQKKKEILLTILYFGISLMIYIIGFLHFKTRANILTVIAVLGLLPSSKSAVRMIMFLKAPSFSTELNERLTESVAGMDAIYGIILTAYEGTYPLSCIVVRDHELCAYTEFPKCKAEACEKHMETMLKQNSFQGMHVKVLTDESKFRNRLAQLEQTPTSGNEQEVLAFLCDISL